MVMATTTNTLTNRFGLVMKGARGSGVCPGTRDGSAYRHDHNQAEQHADAVSEPWPSFGLWVGLRADYTAEQVRDCQKQAHSDQ